MSKQYAKEHSLDIPHFSCVEFPLKIKNLDRALDLVGGKEAILRSCQDEVANTLELRFTKNNIYEHPVNAKVNKNEQILIKISVPKKTLEKFDGNIQKTLEFLHNEEKKPIHMTPLAIINKTFRFREMTDFQYQTQNSQFTQTINNSIHALNFQNINDLKFKQDLEPWKPDSDNGLFDLPPAPRFSSIPLPFNYHYKKNTATILKEGKLTTRNKHIKLHSIIIKWNDEIPQRASPELKSQLEIFKRDEDSNAFFKDILKAYSYVKNAFEIKPIWIRKHLEANLPPSLKQCLKYALPQVAYTYTKGPWRQSYIKFGIDPKKSSDFAKYQTEGFRVPNYGPVIPRDFITENSDFGVSKIFVFDGEELPSSLLFQLENLTDPLIKELLSKSKTRDECDFHDGWFDALTMAKLRRLMRYKLKALVDGSRVDETKVEYILNNLQINEEKDDHEDEALDEDEEDIGEGEDEADLDINEADYDEILRYLQKHNPRGAKELAELGNLIKQKDIDI